MNRVLILEDEPLIAMDLSMAFEDCAIAAVTAVTCAEASTALAEQAIDGAVLDVNLGGGEPCEQIALVLKERAHCPRRGEPHGLGLCHPKDLPSVAPRRHCQPVPDKRGPHPLERSVAGLGAVQHRENGALGAQHAKHRIPPGGARAR